MKNMTKKQTVKSVTKITAKTTPVKNQLSNYCSGKRDEARRRAA